MISKDHSLCLIDHYVDFFLHSTKVDPAGEPYAKNLGAVLTCESIERSLAMFVILLSQSKDGAASLLRMWHTIPDHRAEKSNQNNWYICCVLLKMCRPAKNVFSAESRNRGYDRETAHEFVNRKIVHARLLGVSWTDSRWKLPRKDVIGSGASKITRYKGGYCHDR